MHNLRIWTDAATELTRKTLVSDLKLIEASIASFESKETLKDYQKEDLIYDRDLREALIKVIRYLSTPSQCEEIGIEFDPWETADSLVDDEYAPPAASDHLGDKRPLMEFKDLDFHENRGGGPKNEASPGGIAAKAVFGNYRLSVIRLPGKSLYEVAIFDMSNNFVQLPGIHNYDDDVIPHLTEEEVEEIMLKLECRRRLAALFPPVL